MVRQWCGSAPSSLRFWLLACALGSCALDPVAAQTVQRNQERSFEGAGVHGPVMDRAMVINRHGLSNPALRLSTAQKAEIDKILEAYLKEQYRIKEKHPFTQGAPPASEAIAAEQSAQAGLIAALGEVMDERQRKMWHAAQAVDLRGGSRLR